MSENLTEYLNNFLNNIKNLIPFQSSQETNDKNVIKTLPNSLTNEKIDSEIKEIISKETGLDRVKELFKFDESLGKRADILDENLDILTSIGVSSFILGAILRVNETSETFKRNNQIAVYTDKKAANRAFLDFIYLQTVKGGLKTSFKFMSFTGIILGSSLMIQAFRNKSSPLDYTIGGLISGGLFRMHYGLSNFLVGSVAGSIFGSIFGLIRFTQLKVMGLTYEERRYDMLKERIILRERLLTQVDENKSNEDSISR